MRTAHRPRRGRPAIWLACHQGFYQGESRMLDSLEGICAGQVGLEYPATSVPFSNFVRSGELGPWFSVL